MLYEKINALLLNKIKNIIVLSALRVRVPAMRESYLNLTKA